MQYCVYTKWQHLIDVAEGESFIEFLAPLLPSKTADVEHLQFWKIDSNHHGALTPYPSKEYYDNYIERLQKARAAFAIIVVTLVESNEGPLLGNIYL